MGAPRPPQARSQLGNRAESNQSRVNLPQRSLIMRLSRIMTSRGRLSGASNAELNLGLASHKRWTNEWGPDISRSIFWLMLKKYSQEVDHLMGSRQHLN